MKLSFTTPELWRYSWENDIDRREVEVALVLGEIQGWIWNGRFWHLDGETFIFDTFQAGDVKNN